MSEIRISTNRAELDVSRIHQFLSEQSYWLKGVSLAAVEKAIANSLCFGAFVGGTQVAFGRAVTDLTRFAFLRDIFVFPEYRGRGYGRALVQAIMERLKAEGVSSIMLGTRDAHALYEKFGFHLVGNSPKLMAYDGASQTNSGATTP